MQFFVNNIKNHWHIFPLRILATILHSNYGTKSPFCGEGRNQGFKLHLQPFENSTKKQITFLIGRDKRQETVISGDGSFLVGKNWSVLV